MKKIFILLLACLTLGSLWAFTVNGEGESFDVVITNMASDKVVSVGTECTFQVSYENITAEGGLIASDVDLYFDPAVLQFVSAEGCSLSEWKTDAFLSSSSGLVYFRAADDSIENPVTESGKLYFTVTFKVLATEVSSTELSIQKATGTTASFQEASGTKGTETLSIAQKLTTPTNLTWDGSVAKWNAVDHATGYSVQAYQNGKEMGDPQITEGTSFDFREALTEGGKYTFTVIAVSEKPEFTDSDESAQSSSFYTVIGTLHTPKISLTPDRANGGLEYLITDTNADGTVANYIVEIYRKGSNDPVKTVNTTAKSGNLPCDSDIAAGEAYAATVTAISANPDQNNNSKRSDKTDTVTAPEKVKSLQFKTSPKLTYTEGDKLDLSDMVITLTYESGTTKEVTFKNLEANGLTVNIAHGTELTMGDHNKAITVSYGSSFSVTSANLEVKSGDCPHENTKIERQEPTCGADGVETITCQDCGITVSNTVLNATEEHTFGEWTIIAEPRETINGLKERYCTICQMRNTEIIPPTGSAGTTTDNSSTTPEETTPLDPDDTTTPDTEEPVDPVGDMSDLSKVFLIVVIIIFSLILLFIVGGIWLESRRKKARQARNARQSANRNRRPPQNPNNRRY